MIVHGYHIRPTPPRHPSPFAPNPRWGNGRTLRSTAFPMTDITTAPPRVSADRLRTFIWRVFAQVGIPPDDAAALAELIAEADLRGTDTHGVFRVPLYVRRIKAGGINLRPNI